MAREARRGAGRALPSLLLAAASAALVALAAGGGAGGGGGGAGGGGGGALQRSLGRIAGGLRGALDDLPSEPNYTEWRDGTEYASKKTEFRPGGMAGLYNLTAAFEAWVLPGDVFPEGLVTYDDAGRPRLNQDDLITGTLAYYWGVVALCSFLALAILLFPLGGLCVCCCRCCCGRCGSRPRPAGKRKDVCRKAAGGAALVALATGLLFCVVCALASNRQLRDGLDGWADGADDALADADAYLGAVVDEAGHLLVDNYAEFATEFTDTLKKSSEVVVECLEDYSNATAMMDLVTFVNALPEIKQSIESLKTGTNALRVYASQLNDAMRKVKGDLTNTLKNCQMLQQCKELSNNVSVLQTQIDFNRLPDMSGELQQFDDVLDVDKLSAAVQQGNSSLLNLKREIADRLDESLDQTSRAIASAGATINDSLTEVRDAVDGWRRELRDSATPQVRLVRDYVGEYGPYVYYVGIAVGVVVLLVALGLALGLVCGVCGKRPDGYADNCCNKGAGARFLMCSVAIMFISGAVLAVLGLALFLSGSLVDKMACRYLRDPASAPRYSRLIDSFQLPINSTVTAILAECHANSSAYQTFNLTGLLDVDEMQKQFDVDQYLEGLDMGSVIPSEFSILPPESKSDLQNLTKLTLSAQSDKFSDELSMPFVSADLNELMSQLRKLTELLEKEPGMEEIRSDLQLSLLHLDTYNEKILQPMNDTAMAVMDTAIRLDQQLKMNKTDFNEAIEDLLKEIDDAENTLKNNGTEMLKNITEDFVSIVKSQVNSYLYRVGNYTKYEIGKCGPLSLILNATLVNTCDKIVTPLNGLWFSYISAVVLFILTIITAILVASLYQKYKQYGQYVETEYLYDAYADHGDSVPLNSRGKPRPKKTKKKVKRYEERPAPGGAAGDAAPREGPQDTRYADMAPKHWEDFPNGGPPQYQRAPMEYERPPPYYFPGTEGATPTS